MQNDSHLPKSPASPGGKPSVGNRWRAIGLLAFVFVLGAATSAGGILLVVRYQVRKLTSMQDNAHGPVDLFLRSSEADLARRLALSPTERAAVREELDIARVEFKARRVRVVTEGKALARTTVDRIEARLPAEKREAFRKRAREKLDPWGVELE